MNTRYFTKVENKYVFNVSLIFWHIFIALATLAIVVSLVLLLWSIIPASQRKVEKQAYPEKKQYPAPVKVALSELTLEDAKKEEAPPVVATETMQTVTKVAKPQQYTDTKGKTEYEASLNMLKTIIPASQWTGKGRWYYPQGERFWTFYKQEKYRQWVVSEPGVEDKLKFAYEKAKANNYTDKKQILDGYISIVKLLPETKRLNALQDLINNVAYNISQNIQICQSLVKIVGKMSKEENILYLSDLARFGKLNPREGSIFIDYTASIIDKFDFSQRVNIIEALINIYYNYQDFAKLKEATDLFLPLVAQIKGDKQTKAIWQYFSLYTNKNYERNNSISQIENEHQQAINEIDNQYIQEQSKAQQEYYDKKDSKSKLRDKSLMGIAGGIVLIVLIATILVFLSIQRSVKKIEEKFIANSSQGIPI